MRYVALDFETTGVVAGFPNEPWQLGLVVIEDGQILPETKWETYFRVDAARPFSPRAPGRWAELRTELAAAPSFMEIWPELSKRLVGQPLVAHNARFDEGCLRAVFRVYQMDYPEYEFYDTLWASRRHFGHSLPNHQLQTVAAACGYDLTNHHHALADAEACAAIAIELL